MKKSEVAKILLEKYFGSDRELKSKPDREALMK
jgi:hypothetical protein